MKLGKDECTVCKEKLTRVLITKNKDDDILEEKETKKPEQPGMIKIDIPFTDKQMPVPETEILVTATTTAVVSVAATLTATAAFKYVVTAMKPILKTAWKKLNQNLKKKGS